MHAPHRNLELKARCRDMEMTARHIATLHAVDAGPEDQTDTYFHVPTGRLKLREISGKPSVLIGYTRPDETNARTSSYHLVPVLDAAAMKAVLSDALGIRGVVTKKRHIWLWDNVRIHLDEVENLGNFIEFEAVISTPKHEIAAPAQLEELCTILQVADTDRLAPSYADLLGY